MSGRPRASSATRSGALQNWRVRGGPRFIKVSGRSLRYRRRNLIAWIDERTRNNASEPAWTGFGLVGWQRRKLIWA